MDNRLDYYHADRDVKCVFFALTLIEYAQVLFKSLSDEIIKSWFDLCEVFTVQFTTMKRQQTIVVVLSVVTQGEKETLCAYIC